MFDAPADVAEILEERVKGGKPGSKSAAASDDDGANNSSSSNSAKGQAAVEREYYVHYVASE